LFIVLWAFRHHCAECCRRNTVGRKQRPKPCQDQLEQEILVMQTKMLLMSILPSWRAHRRVQAGLLALIAVVASVVASPSPAMASGDDFFYRCQYSYVSCQNGESILEPPDGLPCAYGSATSAKVCVGYNGDYVYVWDASSDGNSAIAEIFSTSGISERYCRNPYGHLTWVKCNFDWDESATKSLYAGYRIDYTSMTVAYLWSWSGK
jgi:hypothetical protein